MIRNDKTGDPGALILGMLPSGLTGKEKARLFAGLETFANAGDSPQDYQTLAAQRPTFWPRNPSSGTAWPPNEHDKFLDYRDALRRLWQGDAGEQGLAEEQQLLGDLAYLLGLMTRDELRTTFFADRQAVEESWSERSVILPVWGSPDVRYVARGDFESALWLLSRESWRAKVCRQCRRYFVAKKPAQSYCSKVCYAKAKRSQQLEWWNRAGKLMRATKGKSISSAKKSRRRK